MRERKRHPRRSFQRINGCVAWCCVVLCSVESKHENNACKTRWNCVHHTNVRSFKISISTIMMMWPWIFPLFDMFRIFVWCLSHLEEYSNQNKWQENENYGRFGWLNNEQHSFDSWRIHFNEMFLHLYFVLVSSLDLFIHFQWKMRIVSRTLWVFVCGFLFRYAK